MNYSMHKTRFYIVIRAVRQLVVLVLFSSVAITLTLTARGYKYNPDRGVIEATGAIELKGDISGVSVLLNGVEVGKKLPLTIPHLTPHTLYTVAITKSGYHTWHQDFLVEPELLSRKEDIHLWPDKLTVSAMTNRFVPDTKSMCDDNAPSDSESLRIDGGEMATETHLVTRISTPIGKACWFRDAAHIAYITDTAIHTIEQDGSNDTELTNITKKVDSLAIESDSSKLYLLQDGTWNEINLIVP